MTHQSRPPLGEFQATVTNARLDGAEQTLGASSDKVALLVGKVPPRGSSRAASLEGIAIGGETSPGMEQNARTSKYKSPGKMEASTKVPISRNQSQGPHPQKHELLTTEGRSGTLKETRNPTGAQAPHMGQGVGDRAGKSILTAQVKSSIFARISGQDQDDAPRKRTSGSLPATGKDDQKAERREAASAQAVKRGHQVTMIEVPDDEDDTSFQKWVA